MENPPGKALIVNDGARLPTIYTHGNGTSLVMAKSRKNPWKSLDCKQGRLIAWAHWAVVQGPRDFRGPRFNLKKKKVRMIK